MRNITDTQIREKHIESLKKMGRVRDSRNDSKSKMATCTTCGKIVSEKVKVILFNKQESLMVISIVLNIKNLIKMMGFLFLG